VLLVLFSGSTIKSIPFCTGQALAFTVAARPSKPRMGTEHTYRLNGSLLRDVLVDGRWMTMMVTEADADQSRS
jgi:hypothetical protein